MFDAAGVQAAFKALSI
jgi:hypothetical protein